MSRRPFWVLPLLSLLACGQESQGPLRLDVTVPEAGAKQEAFLGRLAVAWFQGNALAFERDDVRPISAGGARIELRAAPSSRIDSYQEWASNGHVMRVGVLAAIDDAATDTEQLWSEQPVQSTLASDGSASKRVDAWCEPDADLCLFFGCADTHDQCYREFYTCDGRFADSNCELTRTEGEPFHKNRWGALQGLAEDYLVIHAEDEIPADQLALLGLYVGDLEPGYHLIRGRKLVGKELDASKACWVRAKSLDDHYRAGGTAKELDVDALSRRYRDIGGNWEFNPAENIVAEEVAMIGTLGLQCPVHQVSYELVDAERARIQVRLSRLAKPLFSFVRPSQDVPMAEELAPQ